MEDESCLNHNTDLFKLANGNPLVFVLFPCSIKAEVRKLVEHGGGQLVAKSEPGCIRLAENKNTMEVGHVHVDYIFDSVKMNCLQPFEKYQIKQHEPKNPYELSDMNSGRNQFSCAEDQAIIDYVEEYGTNTGQGSIKGNYLWKKMEKEKVTLHTWQSMRSRYLKNLMNTAPKFSFNQLTVINHKGKNLPFIQPPCQPDGAKCSKNIEKPHTDDGDESPDKIKDIQKDSSLSTESRDKLKQTEGRSIARKHKTDIEYLGEKSTGAKSAEVVASNTDNYVTDRKKHQKLSKQRKHITSIKDKGIICVDNSQSSNSRISNMNKEILSFVQTEEGKDKLKFFKLNTAMKLFMMQHNMTFLEAFKLLFFANGNLEDAGNTISNGTMENGISLWNYEDDQILMLDESEENQSKIEELIKKRGCEEVMKRIKFLEDTVT